MQIKNKYTKKRGKNFFYKKKHILKSKKNKGGGGGEVNIQPEPLLNVNIESPPLIPPPIPPQIPHPNVNLNNDTDTKAVIINTESPKTIQPDALQSSSDLNTQSDILPQNDNTYNSIMITHQYRINSILDTYVLGYGPRRKEMINNTDGIPKECGFKNGAILKIVMNNNKNNVSATIELVYEGYMSDEAVKENYVYFDNKNNKFLNTNGSTFEFEVDKDQQQILSRLKYSQMVIYLIRHQEAGHNSEKGINKIMGTLFKKDRKLTIQGQVYSKNTARELIKDIVKNNTQKINSLFCSILTRTMETCMIITDEIKTNIPSVSVPNTLTIMPCIGEINKNSLFGLFGNAENMKSKTDISNIYKNSTTEISIQLKDQGKVLKMNVDWSYILFLSNERKTNYLLPNNDNECVKTPIQLVFEYLAYERSVQNKIKKQGGTHKNVRGGGGKRNKTKRKRYYKKRTQKRKVF